jgi:protein-S-isoprenylcysteine O-methyltransferase Ste14
MSPLIVRVLQLFGLVLTQAVFLFISAGTLNWPAGQWYIGLYILFAITAVVILSRQKEALEDHGKNGGKSWELRLTRLLLIATFGLLVLAGLDHRLNWTMPLPYWVMQSGGFLFIVGFALVFWAMYTNKFYSQAIKIQRERGHRAVTEGPYQIVRHPGYLGMTISMFGTVFMLDSIYGLAIFLFYFIVIVARTELEDKALLVELPGYPEYASRTKSRLIPGLW